MRGETKTLDQCQDLKKKKKNPRVFSGNKHELYRPRKQSNRPFQNRENEIASEEERPAEENRYPRFVAAR
jgi:hypothetical protein